MKTLAKKLFFSTLAAVIVALPVTGMSSGGQTAYAASQQVSKPTGFQIYVDGKKLVFEQSPIQKNGNTLVPMRPIFKALNAQLTWIQQTKTIIARKGDTTITLQIGKQQAIINGKSVKLDLPAEAIKGSTMVPLRFVSEALDATIAWNAKTHTIGIVSAEAKLAAYKEKADADAVNRTAPDSQVQASSLSAADIVDMNDDKIVMIMTDQGQGSGIVFGDRWILTNYHVMQDAKSGTVYLNDGKALTVQGIVASDKDSDLAIIQTSASTGVAPVKLGDYFDARKGDKVYAIGSPLGIQNTVSAGLISNIATEGGIDYFQTNAEIDHGSSGGGLFDDQGKLIGITSSGIDDTHADLNFAISVKHVYPLMVKLASTPVDASKLGFLPSELPDSLEKASTADIQQLMTDQFSEVQTSQGNAEFSDWNVTRDNQGWLVFTADLDPQFYTLYGHKTADELRFFLINAGSELKRMLPDETIQVLIYYNQTFGFEPRGFQTGEVTSQADGKWQVRKQIADMQLRDKLYIDMNL